MVDYLAFFDDQHGNSTMGPPLRFWHGATRGLNPALTRMEAAVDNQSEIRLVFNPSSSREVAIATNFVSFIDTVKFW